jgi:hypothetical protein
MGLPSGYTWKGYAFRSLLSFACIAALEFAATPTDAYSLNIVRNGVDPVSRWIFASPATCRFARPAEWWSIGAVLSRDDKQLPPITNSSGDFTSGNADGVIKITGLYDRIHRIAAYIEKGTDTDNFGVVADVAPPPSNAKVHSVDLSAVTLGGNVHLGDTLAQVASAVGLKALHPSTASPACADYSVEGFCSWNRASCHCPTSANGFISTRLGAVVFHRGRVAALFWDYEPCAL